MISNFGILLLKYYPSGMDKVAGTTTKYIIMAVLLPGFINGSINPSAYTNNSNHKKTIPTISYHS